MPASQQFSGTGDPNGVVFGNPGDSYQDETGAFWLKATGAGTSTGWIVFSSAASNVLTFRPGSAETGPVVFNDFDDLYAQLISLRAAAVTSGLYTIVMDDADGAVVIPASAYDMTDTEWVGVHGPTTFNPVTVTITDGAAITSLLAITGLSVTKDVVGTPPIAVTAGQVLTIKASNIYSDLAGKELISTTGDLTMIRLEDLGIFGSFALVLNAGASTGLMLEGGASAAFDDTIAGDGSTTLTVYVQSSTAQYGTQSGFSGTESIQQFAAAWRWDRGDPNGVVSGSLGMLLIDSSSGNIWKNNDNSMGWTLFASSSSSASAANVLTYRPGSGLTGPIVFDSWSDLYTQLDALRTAADTSGLFSIVFDDTSLGVGAPITIPAGAWDMTAVDRWIGVRGYAPVDGIGIFPADGCAITNLKRIGPGLGVQMTGTGPPAITLAAEQTLTLFGSSISATSSSALIRVTGASAAILLEDEAAIVFSGESTGVITIDAGLEFVIRVDGANNVIQDNTIEGGAGSSVDVRIASPSADISASVGTVPTTAFFLQSSSGRWHGDPNGLVQTNGELGFQLIDVNTGTLWTYTGGTTWVGDGVEQLATSSAASPLIETAFVSGAGTDLTLANGERDGFVKSFVVTGGTGTITPANLADGDVLTWTVTPANVSFIWDATGVTWHVYGTPYNMVTT